jgi:HEAT repeat protein
MSALTGLWVAALVLTGAALAWMTVLIGLRLWRRRADARRAADRQIVQGAMVAMLQGDGPAAERLRPYLGRARLMAGATLELLGLIRGSGEAVVLDELRRLGMVETLAARLTRGSQAGRLAALEALALFGGPMAEHALGAALNNSDREIRIAALKGLVTCGAPISVDTVLAQASGGARRPSRLFADILRKVTAANPADAIVALARPGLDVTSKGLLLEALGASGDYAAVEALIRATADGELEVRIAAVHALGRLMHPAAQMALAGALADPKWEVRAAAAEAAGYAGFTRLAEALGLLLGDRQWWVRFRAGAALARMGPPGLDQLRRAVAARTPLATRAAELALAEGASAR